jgi:two-component system, cell cycle response regulator DivK
MVQSERKRPLVLIVDDFQDAREMYAEWLVFKGYRVLVAHDGQSGLDLARTHRPDVIFMDIRMPGITGTEAVRLLRSDDGFSPVPIAALTAHALESERAVLAAAGFDMVLSKPVLPDALVDAIEHLVARRAAF